jgi:uncharacterized protein
MVQRLGDLERGRRSTPERLAHSVVTPTLKNATPGDLSFVLPYRYLADIREMLQALDKISPGVASPETLLYGVEVKFYSVTPATKQLFGNQDPEHVHHRRRCRRHTWTQSKLQLQELSLQEKFLNEKNY